MFGIYHRLIEEGTSQQEAVGIIPHSLAVYDLIHMNGWNVIHSMAKRTCDKAQWEIRAKSKTMAKLIRKDDPVLGEYARPQGLIYGKCPERKPCGTCDKILEKQQ